MTHTKRFSFSSLRIKLQVLVWVAVTVVVLLVVSENILDRFCKEAELSANVNSLVNLAAGSLERYSNNTRPLLIAISHADVIQNGGPATISAFLRDMHERYPEYANLATVDLKGNVFAGKAPFFIENRRTSQICRR